ncbi:hypothetical protein BC937DRAFT_88000, partial [Endogone sp. FLAS-F59071]
MPTLRSIATNNDPFLLFSNATLSQLESLGIRSDKSLLLADDAYIAANTKLSLKNLLKDSTLHPQTIRSFRNDVIDDCKAKPVRGDDLYLELKQHERCFSTGCD